MPHDVHNSDLHRHLGIPNVEVIRIKLMVSLQD